MVAFSGAAEAQAEPPLAPPAIVLINPNSNASATESMAKLAQDTAGDRARVVGRTNEGAPSLLTTLENMALAARGVAEIGAQAGTHERCRRYHQFGRQRSRLG